MSANAEKNITLESPPVVEVVCGVIFQPIFALDSLHQGLFWSTIRERFPRAEIRPPLSDGNTRIFSTLPIQRTWFISDDDEIVIQLQVDRFYLNWRRRNGAYPRFALDSDRSVYARFKSELERFVDFTVQNLGAGLQIDGMELSKINAFTHPEHWESRDDLVTLLPALGSVLPDQEGSAEEFYLNRMRAFQKGTIQTILRASGTESVVGEFRYRGPVEDDPGLDKCFTRANQAVNETFFAEVPDATRYFGEE